MVSPSGYSENPLRPLHKEQEMHDMSRYCSDGIRPHQWKSHLTLNRVAG